MNKKTLAVSFSQGTDEWETPQHLFNDLDAEFHFDLDPCASPATAKTLLWYGEEEDGLRQDWQGHRVFCNPPYSDVKSWVRKAYEEGHKPDTLVVLLLFARTDTRWFHDYVLHRAEVRFLRGRIKFGGGGEQCTFSLDDRYLPGAGNVRGMMNEYCLNCLYRVTESETWKEYRCTNERSTHAGQQVELRDSCREWEERYVGEKLWERS